MQEKMIDICYVRSGVQYHSLSYWSIVMMSLVEFLTGVVKFLRQTGSKSPLKWHNQSGKNKGLLSLLTTCVFRNC